MKTPWIGWALAALAIAVGYAGWGWRGVILGVTVTVFWLLLQFSRALRVMRAAARAPVGHVDSAVMLHTKLHAGMQMLEVLTLTRSLGERCGDMTAASEVWRWRDAADAEVRLTFEAGRLSRWALQRPADGATNPEP